VALAAQPVLGVLSVTLGPLELRQIAFANLRVEERGQGVSNSWDSS
jgi:hypothetical protein